MQEKGIAYQLFYNEMSFSRLIEKLSSGKWKKYQDEDWFKHGVMSIWLAEIRHGRKKEAYIRDKKSMVKISTGGTSKARHTQ